MLRSVAGNDGRFDVAAAVQHVAKDLLEARQRGFAGDVVGGANLFGGDQAEGAAHGFRRVMKCGLERDLRIVQAIGIELDFGAAGASAEEVYGAAFADHFHRPLPSFGTAHRFDDNIATALLRGERAHGFDHVGNFGGLNNFVSAHVLGGDDLFVALHYCDYVAADGAGYLNEHESDGAAADDGDGVAYLDAGFVQAAQHASQRLGHGRV